MSFEYHARLPRNEPASLLDLVRASVAKLPVEILSTLDDGMQLRWTALPRRSQWPEDVTVACDAEGVLVSFHSATGSQRDLLIGCLASTLAKFAGRNVEFEEV